MDNEKIEVIRQKEQEIINLRCDLSASTSVIGDWKISKIYEARLLNQPDPYDVADLLAKRQVVRDKINALQDEIKALEAE